jgi:cellulose synthase/poly-beta-1,6-N-acetylglucosamine synthase-like glycosyltransferase
MSTGGIEKMPVKEEIIDHSETSSRSLAITEGIAVLCFVIVTLGIGVTLSLAAVLLFDGRWLALGEILVFLLMAMLLSYGTLTYVLARIGYIRRMNTHLAASGEGLNSRPVGDSPPSITVLVPSYREELHVVCKTLLSAALQEYPNLRIVLLIDDPFSSAEPLGRESLEATRRLPQDLLDLLRPPADECRAAMDRYVHRKGERRVDPGRESRLLADLNDRVAWWFETFAGEHDVTDYTDRFFLELNYSKPALRYRQRAEHWRVSPAIALTDADAEDRFLDEYRHLANLFEADICSFERKRYVNLSHVANKATNLNCYIGLLGNHFREVAESGGISIEQATPADAQFFIPDTDLILVLDADTLIAPDYAPRLAGFLEKPENERVAVVQCPYVSFPDPPNILQQIAGAQTDIQYLLHQGMTFYDAAYWVGANALVRTAALRQIATTEVENGLPVKRFIQDRTLTEDTETSLNLIQHGWQIFNYPAQLASSATPADFGSLIIQRRRWANGGVVLLPALMRYLKTGDGGWRKAKEVFMRAQYLLSLGPVSIALIFILLFSFHLNIWTIWIFLIAVVYFSLYMRDLYLIGYRRSDLLRVFALNLILVPINLGGLASSIHQAFTGRKPLFRRTPKTTTRTAISPGFLIAEVLGLVALIMLSLRSFAYGYPVHAVFIVLHVIFFLYAIKVYIGIRSVFEDFAVVWRKQDMPEKEAK